MVNSSTSCRVSSSSPPSLFRMVDGTSATSSPSLVQSTGFAVEHVPVSIENFSIEDQDMQAAFRNQLVLSEHKKTANLIEEFMPQDWGGSSASDLAGLYSHLGDGSKVIIKNCKDLEIEAQDIQREPEVLAAFYPALLIHAVLNIIHLSLGNGNMPMSVYPSPVRSILLIRNCLPDSFSSLVYRIFSTR